MTAPAAQKLKTKPSKYDVDRIGQRGIGTGSNLHSLERERRIGSALARDIEAQTKLVTDPLITEYVNGLGQRIVRHSDARLPFTIKVIDSDEIYAFVLPGGYLYVNSGLIMTSDSEAELASILAHEIAHVAARHDARIQRRRGIWKLVSFCSGPAGFAGIPSVARTSWPAADPALLVQETVTCVVQVNGKVRDRLEVSPDITEAQLRDMAVTAPGVIRALAGQEITRVVVRPPKLVNIVAA